MPSRKQITFDLDTKALQQYYPSSSWRNAYEVIKNHMKKNDFSWIQGSAYVSNRAISSTKVAAILQDLVKKNPWLNVCMRDCRETNIGKMHNLNVLFNKTANVPVRSTLQGGRQQAGSSMSDWKSRIAERKANDSSKTKPETKTKVRTGKDRSE